MAIYMPSDIRMKLEGQKLKREVGFVCQLGEKEKQGGKRWWDKGAERLLQLEKGIRSTTVLNEGGNQGGIFCFFRSFEEPY